ncbi:EamA family transporter [Novispirillum sp. DQ9]|uniref:EamA family transporter n=1 Tax=Novispirillum sp. DQ9 TaxID=3398612 RepID=UPI003C7E5BFE
MSPLHALAAIGVAVAWGFNFVVIKVGLHDVPPLLFSALRFMIAAFPAVLLVGRPVVGWGLLVAIGLMLGVVKFGLLFIGMDVGASAGLASLLLQAQVFFTIVLALLIHGEKPAAPQVVGMALGVAGIALIGAQAGGGMTGAGFALVIGAAAAWAVANLLMRRLKGVNLLHFMVWMSLVPVLPLLALSAAVEGPARMAQAVAGLSWLGAGAVVYVGLVATVAGFAVWGRLLTLYPAATVTPFALLVPVVGLFSGWALLGESITPAQMAGAALVLGGLLLGVLGRRLPWPGRRPAAPTPP